MLQKWPIRKHKVQNVGVLIQRNKYCLETCYGRNLFQFLEISRNQIQKLFSLNFVKIYQMVKKEFLNWSKNQQPKCILIHLSLSACQMLSVLFRKLWHMVSMAQDTVMLDMCFKFPFKMQFYVTTWKENKQRESLYGPGSDLHHRLE